MFSTSQLHARLTWIKTEDLIKKLSAMTKLEGEQRKQLENLLAQYPHLFAQHDSDLGHTTLVTHKIPLTDETPIKEKVR